MHHDGRRMRRRVKNGHRLPQMRGSLRARRFDRRPQGTQGALHRLRRDLARHARGVAGPPGPGARSHPIRCHAIRSLARARGGDREQAGSEATEPAAATTDPASPSTDPGASEPAAEAAPPTPRGARLIKDKSARAPRGAAWRKLADWRLATVAGTALVLAAGLHEREAVVRLLPQTAKLYAMAGFPVNLRGIEIRNVKSRLVTDNDEPVLVVDGDLVNVSDRRVDVPRLHFSLLGPDGRQIYVWSAQADRNNLQPGETLNFRRRLAAPPGEARNVSVRFITRSDITAGIK